MLELLFFHISSFMLMWIYYRFIVALIVNIVLGIFLFFFVRNGYDIVNELYIDDKDAVSGAFSVFKDKLPKFNADEKRQKEMGGKQPFQRFNDD